MAALSALTVRAGLLLFPAFGTGIEARSFSRESIFWMYGTASGVTQPVCPWSTSTRPIERAAASASSLRLGLLPPMAMSAPFIA